MSPCCLYIFSPLFLQCFPFPLLPVWFRLPPRASLLGPAGLTQLQNCREVRAEKLVRVERVGSKNEGRLHGRALPLCQVSSWWRLYSSISSRSLSLSLLCLKIATGQRVTGKGEVSTRLCKYRVVSSFVDQVDIWNALDIQIISKPNWANSIFPVETIYVSTLLTFLRALFLQGSTHLGRCLRVAPFMVQIKSSEGHGGLSQKCLCCPAKRLRTSTKQHFLKYCHAIRLS